MGLIYLYMFRHFYVIIRRLQICSLLSYTSSQIAAAEFHNIIIIKMLKYYVVRTIKYNPFLVTIFHTTSLCLWLNIQSAINMDVVICMYKYYIVDILSIHSDGLTSFRCCYCSGLLHTESSGFGLCDMLSLSWPEHIVGWIHVYVTSDCCFFRLWCS